MGLGAGHEGNEAERGIDLQAADRNGSGLTGVQAGEVLLHIDGNGVGGGHTGQGLTRTEVQDLGALRHHERLVLLDGGLPIGGVGLGVHLVPEEFDGGHVNAVPRPGSRCQGIEAEGVQLVGLVVAPHLRGVHHHGVPFSVRGVVPGQVGAGVAPVGAALAVGEDLALGDGGGGAVLNDGVGQLVGGHGRLVVVGEAEVGVVALGGEGDVALLVLHLDLVDLAHVLPVGQSLGKVVGEGHEGRGRLVLHVAHRDVAGEGAGGIAAQVGLHIRYHAGDGVNETSLGVPGGVAGALQADDLKVEGSRELGLGGDLQLQVGVVGVIHDLPLRERLVRHGGGAVALPPIELEGAAIGIVGVGGEVGHRDLEQSHLGIQGEHVAHGVVEAAHVGRAPRTVTGKLNLADTADAVVCGGGGDRHARERPCQGGQEQEGRQEKGECFFHGVSVSFMK